MGKWEREVLEQEIQIPEVSRRSTTNLLTVLKRHCHSRFAIDDTQVVPPDGVVIEGAHTRAKRATADSINIGSWSIIPVHTLLFLGGLHPLCGIGVISFIRVISIPVACIALIAVSLPAPGPFTMISVCLTPYSIAYLATFSAAVCAANCVLFFSPLNPLAPD